MDTVPTETTDPRDQQLLGTLRTSFGREFEVYVNGDLLGRLIAAVGKPVDTGDLAEAVASKIADRLVSR